MSIKGPVYIAGASGHIGTALTAALLQDGIPVCAQAFRHPERLTPLKELAAAHNVSFLTVQGDLCDESDAERMMSEAKGVLGPPAALINAQGTSSMGLFQNYTAAELDRMYAENLRSVALTCQLVIPEFLAQGGGSILNISSMWGVKGAALEAWYSALKAGVIGLTRALARELGPSQIRVNALAPGFIESPMNGHLSEEIRQGFADETPLGRLGQVDDLVPAALFLLSDQASWITGQVISVDGGIVMGS